MRFWRAVAVLVVLGSSAKAQQQPSFDVASIKLRRDARAMDPLTSTFLKQVGKSSEHGRFVMEGPAAVPISVLIELAYSVKDFQIKGLPAWADSGRYDVNAKAEGNATFEQMRPMLQSLLAERCKLSLHRDTRDAPVYDLAISKAGLKITPAKDGSCVTVDPNSPLPPFGSKICGGMTRGGNPGADRLAGFAVTMPKLIEQLSDIVDRTIIDRTGFTAPFSFQLNFGRDDPARDSGAALAAAPQAPSIFTALEEQLGMRLESTKGPVDVLVIDHVEKPSQN